MGVAAVVGFIDHVGRIDQGGAQLGPQRGIVFNQQDSHRGSGG